MAFDNSNHPPNGHLSRRRTWSLFFLAIPLNALSLLLFESTESIVTVECMAVGLMHPVFHIKVISYIRSAQGHLQRWSFSKVTKQLGWGERLKKGYSTNINV